MSKRRASWTKTSSNEIQKMTSDEVLARLNSDPKFYKQLRKTSPLGIEKSWRGRHKVWVSELRADGEIDQKLLLVFHTYAARLNGEDTMSAPPRVAEFLLLLLPLRQREFLLGDLEEEFRTITVPRRGRKVAAFLYTWQVVIELVRAVTTGLSGVALGWVISKFTK